MKYLFCYALVSVVVSVMPGNPYKDFNAQTILTQHFIRHLGPVTDYIIRQIICHSSSPFGGFAELTTKNLLFFVYGFLPCFSTLDLIYSYLLV